MTIKEAAHSISHIIDLSEHGAQPMASINGPRL